jgi:coenzyme Q-binding protein COQ10
MPKHSEKRIVPYTPEQMYLLVADVARYPDFLPWVSGVTIYNRTDQGFDADLSIGTSVLKHEYSSRVTLNPGSRRIDVCHTKGPFRHLNTLWIIHPHSSGSEIEFSLDFELNNFILRKLFEPFLNEAVGTMVGAFETRAQQLFGK